MDGKRFLDGLILEPSAGKGDMIRYIISKMGRRESYPVDAIENDPRLVNALAGEGYNVVWDDFLTYETYKEYDYIIMNPPFSNGVDHVLKAIELAENQLSDCEIYAILNKQTIDNAYTDKRQELLRELDEYGADIEYVSEAFTQSERKTDVEVALIRLKIRQPDEGKTLYETIIDNVAGGGEERKELETSLSTFVKSNEVAEKLNEIERLVSEYEKACQLAEKSFKAARAKQSFYSYIGKVNEREGDISSELSHVITFDKIYTAEDLNEELAKLRRGYWSLILDTREFKKLLTSEGIQKLNRQISLTKNMEINYANIRMLLTAIYANRDDMLIDSIVNIFKRITQHHMNQYSSNIHYYNGWKTNDAYRINKKIIYPVSYGSFNPLWDFNEDYEKINRNVQDFIDDIVKAFQLIDPRFNNDFKALSNQEFENDLLRFKMFMNGNIHVWFNDMSALNKLNYICGQHFNWIPSEEEVNENEEAKKFVVKEFGNEVLGIKLIS